MPKLKGCPCTDYKANKDASGNCSLNRGPDGYAIQCVGDWALQKHDILRRYIEATSGPRAKYRPPVGRGGAAFIDMFAGPGMSCIRDTGEIIDGSPLIALCHTRAPFTSLVFCDLNADNISALESRTSAANDRVSIVHGDCNQCVGDILDLVPEYGLNVALIDPFGPSVLHGNTLRSLGEVKRMDFIIHFPTNGLKRYFGKRGFGQTIDNLVGNTDWRSEIRHARDVPKLIKYLRRNLVSIGYDKEQVRSLPIKNSRNRALYHLMFATKHDLGNKIWGSIARIGPGGQRELDL